MRKNAIAYARVSTDKQSREGLSLGAQEKAIATDCDLYELRLVEPILIDRGISAKSIKGRPGMERLIELVQEERVQAVVVYKIDRMFRSVRDALVTFDLFKERHVEFHSVVEKWDTSTAMGEFAMNMLLSIAQLERRQTSERTRFTLREKKTVEHGNNPVMRHRQREGKLAVGQAPYGWRWVNKELVTDPPEQQVVHEIMLRRHGGAGISEILKWLNTSKIRSRSGKAWHRPQIYRILNADYNLEQSRSSERPPALDTPDTVAEPQP